MKKGAPSVNPSGKAKRTDAVDAVRNDGWINALTGMGVATKDNRLATTFAPDFVDHQTATDLWRGDDMAARLVEAYPEEMLREGYEIRVGGQRKAPLPKPPTGASPEAMEKAAALKSAAAAPKPPGQQRIDAEYDEEIEETEEPEVDEDEGDAETPAQDDEDSSKELQEDVHELLEALEMDQALFEALCYENAYGGGAILLGVDDGQTMDKELDLDRVKPAGFKYALALEPLELTPQFTYDNPLAPKYGKPSHWLVSPTTKGTAKKPTIVASAISVHESRLIIFGGIQVGRRAQYAFEGFGDNIFHRAIRVLRDFNMTWNAASVLVNNFSVAVMKVKNLAELILNDKSGKFKDRMKAIQLSQAVLGMTLVDAEGEDFERKTTSIAGLPELLDKFSVRFGAAADMPLTVIFGQAPAGMDATGENDLRIFYDKTKKKQKKKLRAPLKRIAQIAFRAVGAKEPEQWSIKFCPLWQPTDKEQAETRQIIATTDEKYVAMGAVTPEEIGMSRWGGDEYSPEMHVDFSAAAMEEREAARAAQEELDRAAMVEATAGDEGPPPPAGQKVGAPPPAPREDAFDPDQERDESGRWTDGAGGSFSGPRAERFSKRVARTKEDSTQIARIGRHADPESVGEAEAAKDRDTFHRIEKAQKEGRVKDLPSAKLEQHREIATQAAKHLNDTKNALHEQQAKAAAALASLKFEPDDVLSTEHLEVPDEDLELEEGADETDRENAVFAFRDALDEEPEVAKARADILKISDALDDLSVDGDQAWVGAIAAIDSEADVSYEDAEGEQVEPPSQASPAEYRAGLTKFRDQLLERAATAQDVLEALHERQAAAVADTQKMLKAYEKSRSVAAREAEVDPESLLGEGVDLENEDDDTYQIAEALISFESEDRGEGGIQDADDIIGALKDAQRSTARMAKALAKVTKRPSKIATKPKKAKA